MRRLCKLNIVPNDSKHNNFVLALAEYFTKELRANGLNTKNCNAYVNIILDSPYKKYSSVIIDCINGKMFLRGKNIKDKYFGRLSKFVMERQADAYECVNFNVTRIVNRIRKLFANDIKMEKEAVLYYDTRKIITSETRIFDARINEPICPIPLYGVPTDVMYFDDRTVDNMIYDDRNMTNNDLHVYVFDERTPSIFKKVSTYLKQLRKKIMEMK